MTEQQEDSACAMALEESICACIGRRRDYWFIWTNGHPEAPRWGVILIGWDDPGPSWEVKQFEPCASYREMMQRATALNTRRVRGGQGA